MPTLYRIKAGEIFLKGVPNDHFLILFMMSLKIEGTKGTNFNLQL
jgi:hypothetical protein